MSTVSKTVRTEKNIKSLLNRAFNSKLFPFVVAAIMILCYYTSLDIVAIYFVAIAGILIFLLCDDLTPFITLFVFINVIVSYKNSPSFTAGESNYYYQTHILAQAISLIVLLILAGVYRFIKTAYTGKFKRTPVFYGLCALSAVFILNGIFSRGYTPMNLVYGILQAVIYLGVFALLKDNINPDKANLKRIALTFFALSIVLIIELGVALLTYDNIIVNGELIRDNISFGWGVYNTMGMLLVLCVPSVIYLASRYKHGYLFTIYSVLVAAACLLTTSRQALLGLIVVYPVCLFGLLIWSRKRLGNIIVIISAAVCALVLVIIFHNIVLDAIKQVFSNIIVDGHFYASNRLSIYSVGLEHFESAPVFGVGFYHSGLGHMMNNVSGLDLMPYFYHNTLLQMAASCGIIGLAAYIAHRCQTVVSFLSNITWERTYIAASMLVLLVLSLLDVHMFDIMPTLIYSSLLALLVASEDKKPRQLLKPKQPFIIKK